MTPAGDSEEAPAAAAAPAEEAAVAPADTETPAAAETSEAPPAAEPEKQQGSAKLKLSFMIAWLIEILRATLDISCLR